MKPERPSSDRPRRGRTPEQSDERGSRPARAERVRFSPERKPAPSRTERSAKEEPRGAFIARGVRIVHEDEDIIVLEKPTGLVSADPSRAAGAPKGMSPSARVGQSLFDFVKGHVRKHSRAAGRRRHKSEEIDSPDRPGRVWIIHRLDKEASGLVVFAKSLRAYDSLKEQFRTKQAHRIYMAVAEGVIKEPGFASTHQSFISEDRGNGPGPADLHGEKRLAVTHYRVVATGSGRTLLQVRLDTGRKNQIRVHMQELGHPLVGDARFGAGSNPIGRLGLHAMELGLVHPATNRTVRFNSPVPASFYKTVGMTPPRESTDRTESLVKSEGERGGDDSSSGERPATARGVAGVAAASGDNTSWDDVAQWYDTLLEDRGNDHYEQVILPSALRLLGVKKGHRILDVACGQGILCRRLAERGAMVTGVDAAPGLIEAAKGRAGEIEYRVGDARELGSLGLSGFDGATCVMALGNIDPIEPVLRGTADALRSGGVLVIVISHPAYRNPGQSEWGWDEIKKRQYRRVDGYLAASRREITMHPGRAKLGGDATVTWSFHRPIGMYMNALAEAGLRVERVEELISMRAASSGPRAAEENRARTEFPLFMAIRAVKG